MKSFETLLLELESVEQGTVQHVELLNLCSELLCATYTRKALEYAKQALQLSEKNRDILGIANSLVNCSMSHWYLLMNKEALEEAFTALKFYERSSNLKGQSVALNTIGLIYRNKGELSKAYEYHNQALEIIDLTGDTTHKATTLANIGHIYKLQANYVYALEALHKSLTLCKENSYTKGEIVANFYLGSLHTILRDYPQAISYLNSSLEKSIQEKDKLSEANALFAIGVIYSKNHDYDDALTYHRRALTIRQEINDAIGQGNSMHCIGEIFCDQDNLLQALNFFKQSLQMRKNSNDKYGEAENYLAYAAVYLKTNSPYHNVLLAIDYIKRGMKTAAELSAKHLLMVAYEKLSEAYKLIDHHKQALYYYEKYYQLRNEIGGDEVNLRFKKLEIELATEKSSREAEIHRLQNIELAQALSKVEELNNDLVKLDKERADFLSIVSHDLKNPIAGILLNVSTIERYHARLKPEELLKYVATIGETAQRMKDIVTSLLDNHVIETGVMQLAIESVNVNILIDAVVKDYKTRALAKSLRLKIEIPEEDVFVSADAKPLRECVENYFSNAIKYVPLGKSVTLRLLVDNSKQEATIEVEDEGYGISEEDQKKLFTKFGKTTNKVTGGESSNGLGLSIVKKYIEAMKGSVGFRSVLGEGSTFYMKLPLATAPGSRAVINDSPRNTPTNLQAETGDEKPQS
jgi:signal transduction histidine kinase